MRSVLFSENDRERVNAFVAQHPHGCVEQSFEWGELQCSIDGRDDFYVVGVLEGETILASCLLIRQATGFLGKTWLWAPGGPLLPKEAPEHHLGEVWHHLHQEMNRVAREGKDLFIRFEPNRPAEFSLKLPGLLPTKNSYLPRHTLTMDLEKSPEALLAGMKQKGRYNIRHAEKAGVYVKQVDKEGVRDFYNMLQTTAKRDGFSIHPESFYRDFMEYLDGQAHLYMAYHNHHALGGLLAVHFGDTATYYFGASSDQHREKMAPYALQWFAILLAKEAGLKYYDFLGIADENDPTDPLQKVTQFKTRFGGNVQHYQTAQHIVLRPFWTVLYRLAKCGRHFLRA